MTSALAIVWPKALSEIFASFPRIIHVELGIALQFAEVDDVLSSVISGGVDFASWLTNLTLPTGTISFSRSAASIIRPHQSTSPKHALVSKMSYASAITTSVCNPRLRLLNALRTNSKPIMTFMGLPSFRAAQIVAQTGLDGIIVDCEHGNIGDDSMHSSTAAIAALGVSPLVRLRMTHSDLIKRALDAGAHGIVVPQINTAEEARTVVSYSKFPPQGLRGQGSAFAGIAHGVDIPTYVRTANETLITCVQIETEIGLDNVDAICAVPGIDMLFIGPNDLALSILGYVPAKGDEPEFVEAIKSIVAAARKHGKWVGRLSNDGTSSKEHLKIFDTVAMSYDVRAIQNWYTTELQVARS